MRKRFRLAGLVVAVTLLVGVFLMVSCSTSPGATTGPSSSTSTAPSQAAKPTGNLNVAVDFHGGGLFVPVAKGLITGNTYHVLSSAIFDSLVEPTVEGKPRPGLAERWEIAKDGMTHTFYIRKGVKFHNGDDLTGADVKFSIDTYMAPDNTSTADSSAWRNGVERVELKDDYTVVLHMKKPQFDFLINIDNFGGAVAVLPRKYIEANGYDYFTKNVVGSGPWKVVKYEPNNILQVEAVENHWRAKPKIKTVTMLNIKEEATRVAMLKTGELDITLLSADAASALKSAGNRVIGHYGGSQVWAWPLYDVKNPQSSPFGDVKVRKAMALAVDRKEMADKVYSGFAKPSYLFYAPSTAYFFDSNTMKPDPFDPEQAKKLLAEAGYPNGFNATTVDAGGGSEISTLVQIVSGYYQKIGINASILPMDRAVAVPAMQQGKPEMWNKIWIYASGGGVFNFEKITTPCHSKLNTPKNINNPKIDELIEAVAKTADPAEKKKLAGEAVTLCHDGYTSPTYLDIDTIFGLSPRIDEFKPIQGMQGLGFVYENITLKK